MKRFIFLALIFLGHQERPHADERELAISPARFIGQSVTLKNIRCVDDPSGGFVCVKFLPGRVLVVRTRFIGIGAKQSLVEHMARECQGTANLSNAHCSFDIIISPVTGGTTGLMPTPEGELPLTRVRADSLDLEKLIKPLE